VLAEGRLMIGTDAASGLDAGAVARAVCDRLGLRGGGRVTQAQIGGGDTARNEEYRDAFSKVLSGI